MNMQDMDNLTQDVREKLEDAIMDAILKSIENPYKNINHTKLSDSVITMDDLIQLEEELDKLKTEIYVKDEKTKKIIENLDQNDNFNVKTWSIMPENTAIVMNNKKIGR